MGRPRFPVDDPIAQAYLAWCAVDQAEPEHTLRRRRTVLRSVGQPSTASRDEIEAWWSSRAHLATSTRSGDLAILRGFYKWARVWDHRVDDPTIRIVAPRGRHGAPKPISEPGLRRILTATADDPPIRRAVCLGAYAGLRIAETAGLWWTDINVATSTARVLGKGAKIRFVRFSAGLVDELGDPPADGADGAAINVVTGRARGWAPDTLGRRVNAAIRAAGVDATYHKLRHRYGSVAYQATRDPKALAQLMGHASVATTMAFYAAAADDAAAAIADAVTINLDDDSDDGR